MNLFSPKVANLEWFYDEKNTRIQVIKNFTLGQQNPVKSASRVTHVLLFFFIKVIISLLNFLKVVHKALEQLKEGDREHGKYWSWNVVMDDLLFF